MNVTAYIEFEELSLTVRGYHTPGELDTNTPEEFEVNEVYCEEFHRDISGLLGEARCKQIGAAILARGSK